MEICFSVTEIQTCSIKATTKTDIKRVNEGSRKRKNQGRLSAGHHP